MIRLLPLLLMLIQLFSNRAVQAQCTPVDCSTGLPPYGGLCDSFIPDGLVNTPYQSQLSIVLGGVCFNVQLLDPTLPSLNARITNVKNFTFGNVPDSLLVATNRTNYNPPNGGRVAGCLGISGTPRQAGVFTINIGFLVDAVLCGIIPIPQNNNPVNFPFNFTVRPDAGFTGLNSIYCVKDEAVELVVTGTPGGVFSGPGITGNIFDPSLAGPGEHEITYSVSAQEGNAVAPAFNSSTIVVIVKEQGNLYYADKDGDGFGSPDDVIDICDSVPPSGYVVNNDDCNDADATVNPDVEWFEDKDGDGYSTGNVQKSCLKPDGFVKASELIGPETDCDDSNPDITKADTWFADNDGDGYGDASVTLIACTQPTGYVDRDGDCDDINKSINPETFWYLDTDNDGWPSATQVQSCTKPGEFYKLDFELSGLTVDCNDEDTTVYPGAPEVPNDGIDQDCDGSDLISTAVSVNQSFQLQIFPNPADKAFKVALDVPMNADYTFVLTDITGKTIQAQTMNLSPGRQVVSMMTEVSGAYILRVQGNGEISSVKVLIK